MLAGVAAGGVLAPINSTMLAVALPELRDDFGISHAEIGWLISAYLITMAVAQPIGGRLSDQLGRVRVFRAGLLGFLVCSLAATFAPTFAILVALRTGQAVFGAVLIPNGQAMLRETVPVSELGRVNGLYGAVMSTSAAVGPLLGAALLALGSWRLLFLANVPIVAVALLLLTRLDYTDRPARERPSIDWLGAALLTGLLIFVTLLLNSLRGGQGAVLTLVIIALLATFGLAFVARQRMTLVPLVEWRLFRTRAFAAASSHVLLTNMVMYTILLTIPFFLREAQGKDSTQIGLLLGAMSILMAIVAPLSGRLADAIGRRWPALAGAVLTLAANLVILAGLGQDVSFLYLALALALLGLGIGMSFGPATTAAIESAPRAIAGSAAGTNSMMRYVGSIVGAGILVGVLNTDSSALPGIDVFRAIIAVVTVFAALSIVTALLIHRFPPESDDEVTDVTPADLAT